MRPFGVADLISLSQERCEMRDFKTGQERDEHAFQLRVYALLWWRDAELNPSARRADSLILSYSSGDVSVDAPGEAELQALERSLVDRAEAAKKLIKLDPPEARPSLETCHYCSVRHLCDEYWFPLTQRKLAKEADASSTFGDVQLVITSRHGLTSWDARVDAARTLPEGAHLLLRTTSNDPGFDISDRVRILDVHLAQPEGDDIGREELAVATMGATSEAFLVSKETQ